MCRGSYEYHKTSTVLILEIEFYENYRDATVLTNNRTDVRKTLLRRPYLIVVHEILQGHK